MTTTEWEKGFEAQLDELMAKMMNELPAKKAGLDARKRTLLDGLVVAVNDVLAIFLLYLDAFQNVADGGPLAKVVPREAAEWVKATRSSATRVAGMVSASLCASLEGFITDLAEAQISAEMVDKLRKARNLPHDPAQARRDLIHAVAPSVKADGTKWVKALRDVFGIEMPPALSGSLLSMISFRNKYIHDPREAFQKTVTGEELKCWALAWDLYWRHQDDPMIKWKDSIKVVVGH